MRIEYHPAVEHELRDIIDHYDRFCPGLGADFLNEFEHHVLKIAAAPLLWRIVEKDIRRSLMKRFPYLIYFRAINDDVIRITVIKHQRRHPDLGSKRE